VPLINTSFIIVMVFLLSITITILNMMRGLVLLYVEEKHRPCRSTSF
jgi:hypothetical protein